MNPDYAEKIKEAWRTERAAHVRELRDKDRQIDIIKSEYLSESDKDKKIHILSTQLERINDYEQEFIREFGSLETAKNLAHTMQLLNDGIENYPDADVAEQTSKYASELIQWAEKVEKKKEKKYEFEITEENSKLPY